MVNCQPIWFTKIQQHARATTNQLILNFSNVNQSYIWIISVPNSFCIFSYPWFILCGTLEGFSSCGHCIITHPHFFFLHFITTQNYPSPCACVVCFSLCFLWHRPPLRGHNGLCKLVVMVALIKLSMAQMERVDKGIQISDVWTDRPY